jgi:hypothetical protein
MHVASAVKAAALAAVFSSLAGCATPRTAGQDAAIHKVTIITLLDESGAVEKIGLTIFNNAQTADPQDGALSKAAVEAIAKRLRETRPDWQIVPAGADLPALGQKLKTEGGGFNDELARVRPDIARIVERTGADAASVHADTLSENSHGRGVGVVLRTLPGADPSVYVHATVYLQLLDKKGDRLAGAPGTDTRYPASRFGLTSDIESAHSPAAREMLSIAMRDELVKGIGMALQTMGY